MTEQYKKHPATGLNIPDGPDDDGFFTYYDLKFRPAPNRYRRLFKEHPKTAADFASERANAIVMQMTEFNILGYEPVGMEISPFDWDEIIVWQKLPQKTTRSKKRA